MHWSCAEQPDSGSPKLGLGWNFFSSFPLSSGSLFASMQFFGHSLQQTRNSVALNIALNINPWKQSENICVLERLRFISVLLLAHHKQLIHQLIYSCSCAHQAVNISHFSSSSSFPLSRCISEEIHEFLSALCGYHSVGPFQKGRICLQCS